MERKDNWNDGQRQRGAHVPDQITLYTALSNNPPQDMVNNAHLIVIKMIRLDLSAKKMPTT